MCFGIKLERFAIVMFRLGHIPLLLGHTGDGHVEVGGLGLRGRKERWDRGLSSSMV